VIKPRKASAFCLGIRVWGLGKPKKASELFGMPERERVRERAGEKERREGV
jgi:hypothetical protein